MIRPSALVTMAVVSLGVAACGGSSGSGTTPTPTPTPTANPCTTALQVNELPELTGLEHAAPQVTDKRTTIDGNPRGRPLAARWTHQEALLRARSAPAAEATAPTAAPRAAALDGDQGQIAVLQDQGDMILSANNFDLQSTGLRFNPSGSGFSVTKIDASFRTTLGRQLSGIGDDDSVEVDVPFSFPFYGVGQTIAFINSDGNITFREGDNASTGRSIQRILTGPPRVSPFFSDLDPSKGGKVFVNAASDAYTVTWCGVPAFGSTRTVTTQVTLLRDGSIETKFDSTSNVTDSIVAVAPGGASGAFTPVDLSKAPVSGDGAVGERFSASALVDSIAIGNRFYQGHGDNYDQLVVFADQRIIPISEGAFAYSEPISNTVRGIGLPQFNFAGDYHSGGQLKSVMIMDALSKYNENPTTKINGEFTSEAIIAHECGHQWLAYVSVRDHTGQITNVLLTSDLAHWNFFDETQASFMYGHEWQDLGGGQFRSTEAAARFGRLDQYLMGLIPASQVQPFFYIEGGSGATSSDLPRVGTTTSGTRRDVLVDDVIAAEGDRNPNAGAAPHSVRQAWVYIVSRTATSVDGSQVTKLDSLRQQFAPFMSTATDGRMNAITTLR